MKGLREQGRLGVCWTERESEWKEMKAVEWERESEGQEMVSEGDIRCVSGGYEVCLEI